MPTLIKEFYNTLPSLRINNAREILRRAWERVAHLHPFLAARIIDGKFGSDFAGQIDYIPGYDDGETPQKYHD